MAVRISPSNNFIKIQPAFGYSARALIVVTGVHHKLLAWQLWVLTGAMLVVCLQDERLGEAWRGLVGFLLQLATNGTSAASYFNWNEVCYTGCGFTFGSLKEKSIHSCLLLVSPKVADARSNSDSASSCKQPDEHLLMSCVSTFKTNLFFFYYCHVIHCIITGCLYS